MKKFKVVFLLTTFLASSSSFALQKCSGMHQCPALHDCMFGYCHKIRPQGGGLADPIAPVYESSKPQKKSNKESSL